MSTYDTDIKDDVDKGSYTAILTEIVRRTGTVAWARDTDIVPKTKVWSRWLDVAEVRHMEPEWDGPAQLAELMKMDNDAPASEQGGAGSDC